jgi:hypothetical protein
MRARKLDKYQSLPEQQEFVDAVLVEIGFKHSGNYSSKWKMINAHRSWIMPYRIVHFEQRPL